MKYRDYEAYGYAAFFFAAVLGLPTVLAVLFTALTFRNRIAQILLAVTFILFILGILFILLEHAYNRRTAHAPSKEEKERFAAEEMQRMRQEFAPGARFWAWGSMGQQLEGEFIRWIDKNNDLMEAIVWDPRGGPREKGPFHLSNVHAIKP